MHAAPADKAKPLAEILAQIKPYTCRPAEYPAVFSCKTFFKYPVYVCVGDPNAIVFNRQDNIMFLTVRIYSNLAGPFPAVFYSVADDLVQVWHSKGSATRNSQPRR